MKVVKTSGYEPDWRIGLRLNIPGEGRSFKSCPRYQIPRVDNLKVEKTSGYEPDWRIGLRLNIPGEGRSFKSCPRYQISK